VTKPPVVERVALPTQRGGVEGDLYRPAAGGPHPGVVVCVGVVPTGYDHPQIPRLGAALARAGFAGLIDIRAPLIIVGHDRDDLVIPVAESRRLRSALAGRPGVHYTEFGMFQHMDPTQRKLSPLRLVREFGTFYLWMYPLFRQAVAA
jgi:hypothetical protein